MKTVQADTARYCLNSKQFSIKLFVDGGKMNPFVEKISYITHAYEVCSAAPCKKHALSQTELDIIAFLANNPGKDTASDISTYRYISKAAVSLTVDSLINRGLVKRSIDRIDRRRIHLVLTKKGEVLVPDIQSSRESLRDVLFAGFSSREKEQFDSLFERMAENARGFVTVKGNQDPIK